MSTRERHAVLLDRLLIAAAFTAPLTKLYWNVGGKITLGFVLMAAFSLTWLTLTCRDRAWTLHREVATAAALLGVWFIVLCVGFLNIESQVGQTQFTKGIAFWSAQSLLIIAGAQWMLLRGKRLMKATAIAVVAGITASALWGIVQLVWFGIAGGNIDAILPMLGFAGGGERGIQFFGTGIWRVNGLMRDTNHLGVVLGSGIALAIGFTRGRTRAAVLAILFAALALTLSRSGMLGAMAGLGVLAIHARRQLLRPAVLVPLGAVAAALLVLPVVAPDLSERLISSRLNVNGSSVAVHLGLFSVAADMSAAHPLAGSGYNTFAIAFEKISGRSDFGPHSHYVRTLVETGVLGVAVFMVMATWLFANAWSVATFTARAIAAALAAIWVGNVFYLTTHIDYVAVIYALAVAAPALGAGSVGSAQYDTHARTSRSAHATSA